MDYYRTYMFFKLESLNYELVKCFTYDYWRPAAAWRRQRAATPGDSGGRRQWRAGGGEGSGGDSTSGSPVVVHVNGQGPCCRGARNFGVGVACWSRRYYFRTKR